MEGIPESTVNLNINIDENLMAVLHKLAACVLSNKEEACSSTDVPENSRETQNRVGEDVCGTGLPKSWRPRPRRRTHAMRGSKLRVAKKAAAVASKKVGRGSLLTCGDVESNPGPNRGRNMVVNARNVNVQKAGSSNQNSQPKPQRRRNNRRRKIATQVFEQSRPVAVEQEVAELDAGRLTSDTGGLQTWRSKRVEMSENAVGWYYKYCDPAGAVESGRSVGECGKIPDGLVKYSVDAEIREVFNDTVPDMESDSQVPLDGRTWSYCLISFPMYRTAYIAIANVVDAEITDVVANAAVEFLNNLPDWRTMVEEGWVQFMPTDLNWWLKIRVLRPTYDLGDSSELRTVASWRMTYKSITTETNTPTLINQGFWIGGHFAQDNVLTDRTWIGQDSVVEEAAVEGFDLFASDRQYSKTTRLTWQWTASSGSIRWDGVRQGGGSVGNVDPRWLPRDDDGTFSYHYGGSSRPPASVISYTFPEGTIIQAPSGERTAPGATLAINMALNTVNTTCRLVIQSTTADGGSWMYESEPMSTFGISTVEFLKLTEGPDDFAGAQGLAFRVELPPVNFEQMAPNNPKIEQFLIKDTDGSYLVHSKMRNPVFQLTSAKTFGSLTLDYPGYDANKNLKGPYGIRDSFDANFSTGVVVYRGISHACTLVNKVYQGWEGVTASHTPFGQFGHSGLPVNQAILDLADDLASVRLTGVYPATDNFAAMVAGLAGNLLSQALNSEVTQNAIAGLGQQATTAVQQGVGKLPGMIGSLIGRVGKRLKERRERRRARR